MKILLKLVNLFQSCSALKLPVGAPRLQLKKIVQKYLHGISLPDSYRNMRTQRPFFRWKKIWSKDPDWATDPEWVVHGSGCLEKRALEIKHFRTCQMVGKYQVMGSWIWRLGVPGRRFRSYGPKRKTRNRLGVNERRCKDFGRHVSSPVPEKPYLWCSKHILWWIFVLVAQYKHSAKL